MDRENGARERGLREYKLAYPYQRHNDGGANLDNDYDDGWPHWSELPGPFDGL